MSRQAGLVAVLVDGELGFVLQPRSPPSIAREQKLGNQMAAKRGIVKGPPHVLAVAVRTPIAFAVDLARFGV